MRSFNLTNWKSEVHCLCQWGGKYHQSERSKMSEKKNKKRKEMKWNFSYSINLYIISKVTEMECWSFLKNKSLLSLFQPLKLPLSTVSLSCLCLLFCFTNCVWLCLCEFTIKCHAEDPGSQQMMMRCIESKSFFHWSIPLPLLHAPFYLIYLSSSSHTMYFECIFLFLFISLLINIPMNIWCRRR